MNPCYAVPQRTALQRTANFEEAVVLPQGSPRTNVLNQYLWRTLGSYCAEESIKEFVSLISSNRDFKRS